jgi:hypothetical protein
MGGQVLNLGHPGVVPALWDRCWVSKLTGQVSPEAMGDDYYPSWTTPKDERQTLYSRGGAEQTAVFWALLVFTLIAVPGGILWGWRRLKSWPASGLILAAVLVCWGVYVGVDRALPTIEVSTFKVRSRFAADPKRFMESAQSSRKSGESLRQAIGRVLAEHRAQNPYTGQPIREEDSPGNYTLAEKDGKLLFTLYDLGGTPVTVELGKAGSEAAAPEGSR